MLNTEIIRALEAFAPTSLQESWDNTGLQVGTLGMECTGVLICFDVTPAVVQEAVALGYNLIVSHHPLFFKGVKRLTGETPQQVAAINAISAGISIYSSHTAIDSAKGGVSYALAKAIGVTPVKVLDPLADRLVKIEVIAPDSHTEIVRAALFDAGAGALGDYDCCSFNTNGHGTFRAAQGAHPFVGEIGERHTESETEIAVVAPRHLVGRIEKAILEVHPYEMPAYWITPLLNRLSEYGLGVYGVMDDGVTAPEFVERVKAAVGASTVRATAMPPDPETKIRRVALCGGAGGEYIRAAIAMGAQAYVTSDVRYHDFVDYQDEILLIDAGHYETERAVTQVMLDVICKACPTLSAIRIADSATNPVHYY